MPFIGGENVGVGAGENALYAKIKNRPVSAAPKHSDGGSRMRRNQLLLCALLLLLFAEVARINAETNVVGG